MRSWSKCQCHAQKDLQQAQIFNTPANINVFVTRWPIGPLPCGNRRKYSGKNTKFLCSCRFCSTWHVGGHEDTPHTWETLPEYYKCAHWCRSKEKSNSISMARKSDSPSSQDQNNAPIWSGMRSEYQGLHLWDRRIYLNNKPERRSSAWWTQNSKPSLGGNSVVIHNYFSRYIFLWHVYFLIHRKIK